MKTVRRQGGGRFCSWAWDGADHCWLTGCGYAFQRQSGGDDTGTFLPFPFCPYCGDQIARKDASLQGGAQAGAQRHGGGLRLMPSALMGADAADGLRAGPAVSWLSRCLVGDDQGQDGACVIFAYASWYEIMSGRAVTNATCARVYREALAALGRPLGQGMTFAEGFGLVPVEWRMGRTKLLRATLSDMAEQPLLAGYNVTPAWDSPNAAGCLNHRARGPSRGGHAVVEVAKGEVPGVKGLTVWIENSWSVRWGHKGLGVITEALLPTTFRERWKLA